MAVNVKNIPSIIGIMLTMDPPIERLTNPIANPKDFMSLLFFQFKKNKTVLKNVITIAVIVIRTYNEGIIRKMADIIIITDVNKIRIIFGALKKANANNSNTDWTATKLNNTMAKYVSLTPDDW